MSEKIPPSQTGFFDTGDGHSLFWQEWGTKDGEPLLFVHGGPGCGFDDGYLPLYDFTKVRLIALDQRGTGLSKPSGLMHLNTTDHLIADLPRRVR
jgi:proline iminopeptidase